MVEQKQRSFKHHGFLYHIGWLLSSLATKNFDKGKDALVLLSDEDKKVAETHARNILAECVKQGTKPTPYLTSLRNHEYVPETSATKQIRSSLQDSITPAPDQYDFQFTYKITDADNNFTTEAKAKVIYNIASLWGDEPLIIARKVFIKQITASDYIQPGMWAKSYDFTEEILLRYCELSLHGTLVENARKHTCRRCHKISSTYPRTIQALCKDNNCNFPGA